MQLVNDHNNLCFEQMILQGKRVLMEGALGERLKREYHLSFDQHVAMASLIYEAEGRTALQALWLEYLAIAEHWNMPMMMTTPTRRANQERVAASTYSQCICQDNVSFLRQVQQKSKAVSWIGGLMGCKGDAYTGEGALEEGSALQFHRWQAQAFLQADVDFLYAGIMPCLPEARGMAAAMAETALPYIISFTIRRDGKLIDGTTIHDAITTIDASLERKPLCYMSNCVHPYILQSALVQPWNQTALVRHRFRGIQANTSALDYDQLDQSVDLKCSDPGIIADGIEKLARQHQFQIFGGCCGTDQTHIEEIAKRISAL